MTASQRLGKILRRHRTRAGLSLRGLGDKTGIPFQTLARIEGGDGILDTRRLAVLRRVLGNGLLNEALGSVSETKRKGRKK